MIKGFQLYSLGNKKALFFLSKDVMFNEVYL